MKHTKKLIPAIGMLLLSACMLVTSTFAWFSMNDNVKATDMTVSAVGEQVYLQIVAGNNKEAFIDGDTTQTTAQANVKTAKLLPVNVKKATVSGETTTYSDYVNGNDFVWVKATGTKPNDGTMKGDYSVATPAGTTQYYLENSFMIRLDPYAGAANASGALRVSGVTFAEDENVDALGQTVCVLVVCGDNSELYIYNGSAFTKKAGNAYLDANEDDLFDDDEGVEVKVYVFFNGDHANCTLANLAAANDNGYNEYSVEVTFTVAAV